MSRAHGQPPVPEPLTVLVVDSHCHLDIAWDDALGASLDEAGVEPAPRGWAAVEHDLDRAAEAGVPRIVQIGPDLASARWTVAAVDRYPGVLGGVALHPNEVPRLAAEHQLDEAMAEIAALALHPRVRAIGETGLDHFRTPVAQWGLQEELLRRHAALARELGKALVIHDRQAHADVLRVMDAEPAPPVVVVHCFSGDAEFARACVDRGWVLSFAGTVTFASAGDVREGLAVTPLEQVLVETDAPFLAPVPYRGRPNASCLVPWTVRAMATVRDEDLDELCAAIATTSERVFGPWSSPVPADAGHGQVQAE